jgi:AcrR family transcriptional regulator
MTTEDRILRAALSLLEKGGVEAVTTRAVCQAAKVTAPTLYHHFGDKDGLLGAIVAQGVEMFMAQKRANRSTADATADLRRSWDNWIAFALERPQLFRLMIENTRANPAVSQEAYTIMRAMDAAAQTIWAGSSGILTLFARGTPPAEIRATSELLFDALVAKLVRPPK